MSANFVQAAPALSYAAPSTSTVMQAPAGSYAIPGACSYTMPPATSTMYAAPATASQVYAAPAMTTMMGGSAPVYAAPSVTSQMYAAPTAMSQTYAAPTAMSQTYAAPAMTTMTGRSATMMVPPAQVSYPQVQYTQGPSNLTYMGAPLTSGGSMAMPSVQYGLANASGSVEVPVYGGQVDVSRMYQTYAQAAPTMQAPMSPVPVATMSAMSAEQMKFIFPHGAPQNYAPAAATVQNIQDVPSMQTVAAAPTVVEVPMPAPTIDTSAEAMAHVVSSKKSSSEKKKSSKKKLSSKKKDKGGCC